MYKYNITIFFFAFIRVQGIRKLVQVFGYNRTKRLQFLYALPAHKLSRRIINNSLIILFNSALYFRGTQNRKTIIITIK